MVTKIQTRTVQAQNYIYLHTLATSKYEKSACDTNPEEVERGHSGPGIRDCSLSGSAHGHAGRAGLHGVIKPHWHHSVIDTQPNTESWQCYVTAPNPISTLGALEQLHGCWLSFVAEMLRGSSKAREVIQSIILSTSIRSSLARAQSDSVCSARSGAGPGDGRCCGTAVEIPPWAPNPVAALGGPGRADLAD